MSTDQKATARKEARAKRQAVPAHVRKTAGAASAAYFLNAIPLTTNSIISAFWPLGDEFETQPLLHALAEAGHQLALPVVVGAHQPLCFRRWHPGDEMAVSSFGVSEPLAGAEEVRPHIVVVPFLAYNASGFRLGYGGGYYDRTLKALRQSGSHQQDLGVLAVGLGFTAQAMEILPYDSYDEPLDWLISENGAQQFVRNAARCL
ncbi:MAG: 5-formyltetrahydrofolate cyclo-ligase [Alphaproteobacteria bacterium]|jgi:5-formyltetrahydrofolate cyclo-ligase|nr:5-formyltetrahydrofolate cyclo-ligase [Alphaproteobacteria bacterium]